MKESLSVCFKLGETDVNAVVYEERGSVPTMLNVHDDENTAVEAGKANIAEFGGRLIELVHSGDRLITFELNKRTYSFDPNRIFSDAGITSTLKKHSAYSQEAHTAIKRFAEAYLRRFALEKEKVIIALHNTVDGLFSVESFLPDAYLGSDAAAIHVSKSRSKFDFFFVTETSFFDFLKKKDFNVVLQDNQRVTEDGSLSVHFSKKGIPYINVEAEMNHLPTQIEMLRALREMLQAN